jgi:hypothetical protein
MPPCPGSRTRALILNTKVHPVPYKREIDVYEFDYIRNSPYIRSIYESVDNGTDKCMVFEWMEHDLWSLRHKKRSSNSAFSKTIAKSALQALAAFSDMDGQGPGVHMGKFFAVI